MKDSLADYDVRAIDLDEIDSIEEGYMGIFLDLTYSRNISKEVIDGITFSGSAVVSILIQNTFLTYFRDEVEICVVGDRPGVHICVHIPLKKEEIYPLVKELIEKHVDPRITMIKKVLSMKLMEFEKENLIEKERLSREFIDMFSHDVGLPLTVLKGNIEMIKEGKLEGFSDEQKKALEAMEKSVERIDNMRKESLFLNKMDSGVYRINRKLTSISGIIEDSVNEFLSEADRKNQTIETRVPYLSANIDPEKFKHVVDNLLSNAIKYTPAGGKIEISLEKDKDKFRLLFKDNGPGIPEGMEEKIFNRFVTVGPKRKDSTGLGLSIVKEIVESHGGSVRVEHPEEGGSLFVVEMPK